MVEKDGQGKGRHIRKESGKAYKEGKWKGTSGRM